MITRTEILSALADSIREATAGEAGEGITEDQSFRDDLELDSLAMVEIAVMLEEELGVKIPDEDLPGIVTVADAVNYIAVRDPAMS